MRVGNYSVLVEGGTEKTNGHVKIPHNQQFSIRLGNHDSSRQCDAELSIDGEHVDTFRLRAGQVFSVEGPTEGDRGRFTALGVATEEGLDAGSGGISRKEKGLIVVRFLPEYVLSTPKGVRRHTDPCNAVDDDDMGGSGEWSDKTLLRSSGPEASLSTGRSIRTMGGSAKPTAAVTGLTGRTDQAWHSASQIDHDPALEVVISLRLATTEVPVEGVRPLKGAGCRTGGCGCRPRSNPVPAPVD